MPFQVAVAVSTFLNEWIYHLSRIHIPLALSKSRHPEPKLSKELADVVLFELEQLIDFLKVKTYLKRQNLLKKNKSVEKDLAKSELKTKKF